VLRDDALHRHRIHGGVEPLSPTSSLGSADAIADTSTIGITSLDILPSFHRCCLASTKNVTTLLE
jgi:hypothetical protein